MTKSELQAELDKTRAELQQYIGWKTSAQIEYRRAEAADNMLLKAIARAEAAEAALAELQQLYNDRDQDLSFEYECAQKAEAELKLSQALTFAAIARTERAEAALAERDEPCEWEYKRYGGWFTTCGNRPAACSSTWQNCPYCGHPIKVQP